MTEIQEQQTNPLNELKLKDFVFDRVLSANQSRKTIFVLGKFSNLSETNQAIVTIESIGFTEEQFKDDESSLLKHIELELDLVNDIYVNCFGYTEKQFNSKSLTI
jgi:hypothetical protein